MNIFLTFDYELYFGERSGSVQKCIIDPTEMLMKVSEKHGVKLVQFVDVGFLIKLDEFRKQFPTLENDYELLKNQLHQLVKNGHEIQLHIHPHWEDSFFDGSKWVINIDRYRIHDFDDASIKSIVKRYIDELAKYTDRKKIIAYRAGGWCIQPFEKLKASLKENDITIDSSVFKNGFYESQHYSYDFRNTSNKSRWKFENDPCSENVEGNFLEIPIASRLNSPLFYWSLFLLGRLDPFNHKPLGDGVPIPSPGLRCKMLTKWTYNTVSVDGYNAVLLNNSLKQYQRKKLNDLVIIGHPKALSRFGLNQLDKFIAAQKEKHNFTTFGEQLI